MFLGRLATLLSLLSGVPLLTGSGMPGPQPWAAANQTWALEPLVPAPALGSWKTFLGLQKTRRQQIGSLKPRQEVATAVSLPLDPKELTQEMCKAVPFIQVVSRPGCTATHLRNHLCFGRCSSLYIPSSDATPIVLCNSCVPSRKRWASTALWCHAGSPATRWRVKISTMLIEGCQCSPKA
ncbi:DAN domain family member 5 [Nycticebus coucang]|uniref:DAN domain family member 5 n=1 Tax=Nycticebus coucang TaxID=9470 RepID=UPI00234C3DCE|nr:DAN domain family member 5 [Nycticebus coucang]